MWREARTVRLMATGYVLRVHNEHGDNHDLLAEVVLCILTMLFLSLALFPHFHARAHPCSWYSFLPNCRVWATGSLLSLVSTVLITPDYSLACTVSQPSLSPALSPQITRPLNIRRTLLNSDYTEINLSSTAQQVLRNTCLLGEFVAYLVHVIISDFPFIVSFHGILPPSLIFDSDELKT